MPELTPKELEELRGFVNRVQSWNSGGPYGDGEEITDKKGYATMERIRAKLNRVIVVD
jgi:hypothetical protein